MTNDHRHERFMRVLTERLAATEERPHEPITADFGTVGGFHTATELSDLLKAKDTNLADIARISGDFLPQWQAKDSAAAGDWSKDWTALQARYASAKLKAQTALTAANSGATNPVIALGMTDAAYTSVIKALKQAGDPGPMTKGDLQDLANRLSDAGQSLQGMRPTPQPTPGSDADLNLLNSLAKADIAGVLTGQNTNPTAQKLAIGLGVGAGVLLLLGILYAVGKAKR